MNAKTQERKFKQTEIGEIPADWEVKRFGNIVEYSLGKTPPRRESKYWAKDNKGFFWVSISDMKPFSIINFTSEKITEESLKIMPSNIVHKGTLLMSFKLTIGRTSILGVNAFHNEAIISIKPKNDVIRDFLLYYLPTINYSQYYDKVVKGQTLNKSKLNNLPVILPPKPEQEKIVEVLTKIQNAVENQEKLVKNLKELKSATMAKLFREGLNGEPLKQTEIGEIPKSWEVMRLGEIVDEIFAGGDVPKNNFSKLITDEYKIPIYTNGEKKQGLYGYTNIIKVSKPSLTISSRGTIGYCVLREKPYFPAIRLIVILPNLNIVSLYYLKFAIEINNFEKYFDKSPIPQLTVPMAKRIIIPLPNKDEQEEIANILTSIDNKIEIEGKKLEVYNEFFSSTLNQLMTGKIRVN
jgi:type I restriction enzyme S subunit